MAGILTSPIVRTLSDTGDPADIPDHQRAERARRLLEAAQGKAPADIWTDVLEVIVEHFQTALEGVMDKRLHPDVLSVYRDLLGTFDEKVVLGATAMQRLIRKRMVLSEAAEHANRGAVSSTTGGA